MTLIRTVLTTLLVFCAFTGESTLTLGNEPMSGSPIFPGWYADPEVAILDGRYWVFPTRSLAFDKQTYFDCFSSEDLVSWKKHEKVLKAEDVKWARRAMWAPSIIEKEGKFYFFFGANDVHEGEVGGIGVAVADKPEGPYRDLLGKPLINEIVNGAQPIDQFVFQDDDGEYYMLYGGWGHCNIVRLKEDFTGLLPFEDGQLYREITPENYVEGPCVFKKDGKYYFMWSEGGWTGSNYQVAYAIADSLCGPYKRIGVIIKSDPQVGKGAGHHSVLHSPSGRWYAIYHRRPLSETDGNSRETCIDYLEFNDDGTIKPVKLTFEGVTADPISKK